MLSCVLVKSFSFFFGKNAARKKCLINAETNSASVLVLANALVVQSSHYGSKTPVRVTGVLLASSGSESFSNSGTLPQGAHDHWEHAFVFPVLAHPLQ